VSKIQPETSLASGTCFVTGCMNPATHKVYNPLPGSYDYAMLDVCEGHYMREGKLWWYRGRLYDHSKEPLPPPMTQEQEEMVKSMLAAADHSWAFIAKRVGVDVASVRKIHWLVGK
jgi:hypothetical protein